ncbi:MAG: fatty acid desaturase, partial [Chloroflexi bacterium]|nr:fatty acid desaturase [Chloroflexota bacterium]
MSGETIKTQLPQKTNELPWRQAVQPYQFADARVSIWQMINSIGPYFVLWVLAYLSLSVSYALTLFFAFGAGLFAVRIFIIFHDCGHGSFFKSKRANDLVGMFTGILTFTPYHAWRHSHAVHHATSGDLDRRGVGDVWTLTYEEYHSRPLWIRLLYRVYRNPFFVFLIAPTLDFVVLQRLPQANSAQKRIEKNSVIITNL